jgi:hypothetical protein
MWSRLSALSLLFALALVLGGCGSSTLNELVDEAWEWDDDAGPIERVVHISVDGLRPDAVTEYLDDLPAFAQLRRQGAFTNNARTSPARGNTLPNHASQLTGRVVAGEAGHGWATNRYPDPSITLHSNKGAYVPSVFDAASNAGLRTALFASKSKFAVFQNSYADVIDTYLYTNNTGRLVDRFVDSLQAEGYGYAFLHLRNPDTAGHRYGWRLWGWHPYMRAVRASDRLIGQVLDAIQADPDLRGTTAVIVTADHGGTGHSHGADNELDYTVPFYVWGPGIEPGDLYERAGDRRADPGTAQIPADAPLQPIRNGDAANLALALLGLDPVEGSTIGSDQPLLVDLPESDPTVDTLEPVER